MNRGTAEGGGVTTIGDNNLLMAYVHIAHDCRIGNNNILANAANLAGHVIVEDNVILGGIVAVHQFTRLGKHAFVGGASAIAQDVAPYVHVVGNRAKLAGLNTVGLRRHKFSSETISNLNKAYKILFRSKKRFEIAAKEVEQIMPECSEAIYLIDFLRNSQRGFIRKCKRKESV